MLEKILVAGVGLLGTAKASKHAHCPQFASVAGRVDTTSKRILARKAQVLEVVYISDVNW